MVFIYSSVDRHLGCLHFVPIMNNAAMNIRVLGWIHIFISLGQMPRVELLGQIVTQHLTSCKTAKLFSKGATSFYIAVNSVWVLISPHLHQHLLSVFCYSHSFIMVLRCISLITQGVEHLFMSLLIICVSSLKHVYSNVLPFLNWVVFQF